MKLYGYWRSSSSYRARIFLGLKGLEYTYVPVHLLRDGGEQHAPDFVAKSPLRQVPVLEVEGPSGTLHLTQTVAMAEYLEEVHPEPALYPREPRARARAREVVEIVNSGIQPLQNLRVLRNLSTVGVEANAWCQDIIGRGLFAVEARLAETAGAHAVGDQIGIVEAFIVPQLYAARRFDLGLDAFPTLLRVEAAALEHPAVAAAHPDRQPDAPPPDERPS